MLDTSEVIQMTASLSPGAQVSVEKDRSGMDSVRLRREWAHDGRGFALESYIYQPFTEDNVRFSVSLLDYQVGKICLKP